MTRTRLPHVVRRSVVVVALIVLAGLVQAQTADQLYRDAERSSAEKSFGTAAERYQALIDQFPGDPRVTEAQLKVGLCRLKLEQYNEAVKLLEPYVEAHKDSFWAAKARRILVLAYGGTGGSDDETKLRLLREGIDYLEGHLDGAAAREELAYCLLDYDAHLASYVPEEAEQKERREKAMQALRRVVELKAGDDFSARATFRLAQHHADKDERDKSLDLCRRILATWPRTYWAPRAQLWIADDSNAKKQYVRALDEYREVVRRWAKSDAAEMARRLADNIAAPQVYLELNGTALPGSEVPYRLSTRNVKHVRLAAYETNPVAEFLELGQKQLSGARPSAVPVKEWTLTVPDPSGHKPFTKVLQAPLPDPGVYHVVARDGDSAAKADANVNVTSLVILQAQDPTGKLVTWVSRRTDGGSVEQARLDYRYRYWEEKGQSWRYGAMGDSATDGKGLSTMDLPDKANQKEIETLARAGKEVAWLTDAGVYFSREHPAETVGYVYTDRPVYRPGQEVQFSAVLRTFTGGEVTNLPGKACSIEIRDARDEQVLKTDLTTSKFGSLHGDFTLGDEPPLGMYRIIAHFGKDRCAGQFRVEEYKKPEFEVTVKPGGDDYKPGEKASATITAEYYFGGPVPGAKVTYTVRRQSYWSWFRFGRRYDWFFSGFDGWWRPRPSRGEGDVVARGEATTDAHGKVTIEFDTLKDDEQDYQYDVSAEVTDQSRRTIEGSKTIKVTRNSFTLHLDTQQSLYHAADKVTVDIKAMTPNDTPVRTSGKVMVYKLIPDEREVERDGEKVKEKYDRREPILDQPLAFTTDAEGLAHVSFVPDREGRFEIEATADDPKRDQPAKGTRELWAVNDGFDGQNLDYTNLELVTERDVYEKGERARILISAPVKDRDVLLWIGGRDLLSTHVLRLNGSAKVFELPIVAGYVPDITIEAHVLGSDRLYSATKRLFVPPSDKFLQVSIASDKSKYRPREKGHFEVTALTKDGKPADAEVCLAVTDESVYYVQSELVGPIERFFYARGRGGGIRSWQSWGYEHALRDGEYQFAMPISRLRQYRRGGRGGMMARAAMAPAPPAEALGEGLHMDVAFKVTYDASAGPGGPTVEPTVRTQFADTCFWGPTLLTGADGKATAEVEFPDNLTTWRTTARALTTDTKVGQKQGKVVTSKDIIARLQTPRFLVQRDVATISTIAHNYLDQPKDVRVEFAAQGLKLDGQPSETVRIEQSGEVRVDRRVEALEPGKALLTTKALTDVESDAMQLPIPILPHGAEKFVWRAGQVSNEGGETFELPAERGRASDSLVVQVTPSIAAGLLDALPYLAGYPYGCVEQTMNRFLPSVIVADTVKKLGLDASEKLADVPRMVKAGLRRLYSQRNSEGGWGWWAGGEGDLYMTAYVVSGLLRAKAAGYNVDSDVLSGAISFIQQQVKQGKRLDTLAYAAYVLAQAGEKPQGVCDAIYEKREELNEHSRALLALTLAYLKDDRSHVVVRNMVDYRVETDSGCHWGKNDWGWWWSEDRIEATAASLLALLRVEPQSPLIPKTVWWLVTNRRGADHWKSTKDTALAIAALSEYLLASKEQQASYTASVYVNDKLVKGLEVTPQNALQLDGKINVAAALLRDGKNTVRITRDGRGALYYALLATYYTLEEPITGAKSVISVDRKYYTIEEYVDDKQQLRTKRTPLAGAVKSGTQLEVELTITSENDFDYVMFEDYKPAGCEPVDLKSGYVWDEGLGAYREFRDEKVAFFIDHLPQGAHKLTYRVRAEIPGDFHALPNVGQGMYMPDVRCLSDEGRIAIR